MSKILKTGKRREYFSARQSADQHIKRGKIPEAQRDSYVRTYMNITQKQLDDLKKEYGK